MSEQIKQSVEAVATNAATISDKLIQYMSATEEVLKNYGGDVAELGFNVLRIEAGGQLVTSLLGMIVFLALAWFSWTSPKRFGFTEDFPEHPITLLKIIGTGISGLVAILNTINFINVWYWVGLFWPEAYAVHKFLSN